MVEENRVGDCGHGIFQKVMNVLMTIRSILVFLGNKGENSFPLKDF